MNINVNGKDCLVGSSAHLTMGQLDDDDCLGYDSIIMLAGYPLGRVLTVTYTTRRSGDEQRQGSLMPGHSVCIENNMIFNVADTSNA